MNQTRTFLLIAWLVVVFFLWDAWQKDYVRTRPVAASEAAHGIAGDDTIPPASTDDVPVASTTPASGPVPAEAAPSAPLVLANDMLSLVIDGRGGAVLEAELLHYSQDTEEGSPPVQLLSRDPAHFFTAQTGWTGAGVEAPNHQTALQPESGSQQLAEGADAVELAFSWRGQSGLVLRRLYRLERGSYELQVRDELQNTGAAPWRGNVYRQLMRKEPPSKGGGLTNPEAYSFVGAAWYSPQDRFEKLKFADFEDEPLRKDATGGWIAMLQHYFVGAWIPDASEQSSLSTATSRDRYVIRSLGPSLELAPGATAQSQARLFLGPKLQDHLEKVAPGFDLNLDYGIFTIIAQPLNSLLSLLHRLTGNWGWAIVLLVVLIKLALFKLSEAQYKSFAKMRRIQPRIEALKERYGDDRQKLQMAQMELFKQEKINPMGGCLPMLVQIPIFIALYWVLLESVELRHAPWIGWIENLTAPDPYFVLPLVNLLAMWATQKLTPAPGMDPIQKKMMQLMPLVFGVMFAFFPAGLVLYWATNGLLGLLQQWIITRRHGEPAKA